MTIVIAGYYKNDLFFIGDTAITQGNKILLSGFKKIYALPIITHKPIFSPRTFRRYRPFDGYSSECVVALAGSTLIAQHLINTISEHLRKIRIIHQYNENGLKLSLLRHCDIASNPMYRDIYCEYSDDIYTFNNMNKAINVNEILNIIDYSIDEAFSSASSHIISEPEWERLLKNEYLIGIHDSSNRKNLLFKIKLDSIHDSEGLLRIKSERILITESELAVIGLNDSIDITKQYLDKINDIYQKHKESDEDLPLILLKAVEDVINEANGQGYKAISKPIILKKFNGRLEISIMVT